MKIKTNTTNSAQVVSWPSICFMKKSKHILFLFFVLLLIISEYYFLLEYFGESNLYVLMQTGSGVLAGIGGTVAIIRKFY